MRRVIRSNAGFEGFEGYEGYEGYEGDGGVSMHFGRIVMRVLRVLRVIASRHHFGGSRWTWRRARRGGEREREREQERARESERERSFIVGAQQPCSVWTTIRGEPYHYGLIWGRLWTTMGPI